MGVIIDAITINPNLIYESPEVQGSISARETKVANEESIKSEIQAQQSVSKEVK